MNEDIILEMSNSLNIDKKRVEAVLKMLSDGNTIPFIARYRKEVTGGLDEEIIRKIDEVYQYQVNLFKRKEDVIRLIDEKGLLTEEIKNNILKADKLVEVEDIYRPYKEKKKTKATIAINNGLEPLAKIIMSFPTSGSIDSISSKYINNNVKSVDDAINGAKDIIAEWISDNSYYRKYIRNYIIKNGVIKTKLKKNACDSKKLYEMYYDYNESIKYIKSHRILAINRAEDEKVISVSLDFDNKYISDYIESKVIKNKNSFVYNIVVDAIEDSLKRLIYPSVEREVRALLSERAEVDAIDNFSKNLHQLLLTPPIKEKVVMGYDPGFRTGCKLAVVDKQGNPLDISVIYPTEPHNKIKEAEEIVLKLIDKYDVDIIAIGNGTASRESEEFISSIIPKAKRKISYVIVSEAGASVYSASKLAISEFPDLTVEKRSAISIARRLQDSLAELVKIDPKSIGVGLYQHDVTPKKLDESLQFVVVSAVNDVGVNVNTASSSLLSYVSGMTKKAIDAILDFRSKGKIKSREEIKKLKGVTPKVYEQSIGFMRVIDGDNFLDKTSIHPESYKFAIKIMDKLNIIESDIGHHEIKDKIKDIDIDKLSEEIGTDKYTTEDIINSLERPNRDPRDQMMKPLLRSDILKIEDLHVGDKLQGTVRNVIDFGAFVDIGLHDDGLLHISKISKNYIKHPSDYLSVGDIIEVYVDDIDLSKNRVNLSMIR